MTCSRAINNSDICPPTYPALSFPAVNKMFKDVDYGTPLVRVTNGGGQVNDSPSISMFSADSKFFYIRNAQGAFVFYKVETNAAGKVKGIKQIDTPHYYYGFPVWDTVKPNRFFELRFRQVWRHDFTVNQGQIQWKTPVLELDFSIVPNNPIPPSDGGYPYGLFYVTPDIIAVLVSTTNGQETFDTLVIYDRKTKKMQIIDLAARIGWDKNAYRGTHGMQWDLSGQMAFMQLNPYVYSPDFPTFAIAYDRLSDTFSPRWSDNHDGYIGPGGHVVVGAGWEIGGRYAGGGWSILYPQTKQVVDPICLFPKKNGFVQWCDQHPSHLGPRGFIASFYSGPSNIYRWTPNIQNGQPWALLNYRNQWSLNVNDPEELRYKRLRVPNVRKIPDAPNGWWYDKSIDSVYFWPSDTDDPNGKVTIFDWFVFTDEIVRFIPDMSGDITKPWSWERLIKHRCHNIWDNTFYTIPKGNLSPDGSMLLFLTNWDGTLPVEEVVLADIL